MLSIFIFAAHVLLFGAIAVYLHYQSEHFGLAPLLFYVAGIMSVLNFVELITLFVEPSPGIIIRPGGHVYVPVVLLIVLILYISSGTRTARIVITGLIGIDALILVVLLFILLYLNVHDPSTTVRSLFADADILTPLFLRGVIASTITFFVNMLAIIITYQGIKNTFPTCPQSAIPGIALLIALWVDTVLYNILAFLGTPNFVPGIPGDVVMKTLAGLLLAPLAGWYLTRVAPRLTHYQGAEDRPVLAILFGDDRTASRLLEIENELQVSRAIYEQIMQHIEEVFWLVDIEKQRLLYLSPNFEKLTGRSPEIFYKNPSALMEVVHPDDRARADVQQLFLSSDREFRIQHTDGSTRWLYNRSFPITTPDQQIVRYAGITEDVTARREAQAQAFALELSHEKVKLLQRFVRDASHDLRAPLTSILLKLEMLPKAAPTRQKELQSELQNAAQHLSSLIDDLFTLSHVEGEGQVILTTLDLNAIVQQVGEDHRTIAQNKNLSLTMSLIDRELSIVGNKEQLFRLVGNLVGNAIHYTEQGTITVRSFIGDGQAILEIADTGIGIPQDRLESIFERFFRTDEARSLRHDGTGLGLAICKAIVEQHHGTITAQSTLGKGTTFRVAFRLSPEAEPVQPH